jgi:hypothetical protein
LESTRQSSGSNELFTLNLSSPAGHNQHGD